MRIPLIRLYDIFRKDLNLPDDKAVELIIALHENRKAQIENMSKPQIAKPDNMEAVLRRLDTGINEIKREIRDLREDMRVFER